MPLLPIDLQTLFAQMNQVGKEQAIQKNISPLHQSLQGNEIVKQTEEKDNSVNETKEVSDGVEKIKDKNAERKEKESSKGGKKEQGENKKKGVFNDPDLGQHIDIVG
ncbi:MAG: hypothetical protein DRP57_00035 [Spirochaetes bacterium]|nr:MAG: hypothetical protein DRP57_00035 [Spirochaetota bacterium]